MSARAPQPDPLFVLADRCVQCGLCLPACPTYATERIEAESPRGRIALARAWSLEVAAPTEAGDVHLDACLACGACASACPAEVDYPALLVEARRRQRTRRPPVWRQRAIEALVARPRLLSAALGLWRRLWALSPSRLRPLPAPPAAPRDRPASASDADTAVFAGCVGAVYEAATRDALVRLGRAAGWAIDGRGVGGCCGAIHRHAGDVAGAEDLAERLRAMVVPHAAVATLASGCHAAVAQACGEVATVDAIEALEARAGHLRFEERRERVALHLPCTQRTRPGSVRALRSLLARVPGLEVVELPRGPGCCGAAGTAMLVDPTRAAAFRAPVVDAFGASGATRLLSANLGCRLHLQGATARPVQHPLELLAEALPAD